jgi:ClpP class serine protease
MNWRALFLNQLLAIEPNALQQLIAAVGMEADAGKEALAAIAAKAPVDADHAGYVIVNRRGIIPIGGLLVNRDVPYYYSPWMTGYANLRERIAAVLNDEAADELLLAWNCPGGVDAGCTETADFLYAQRGRKPITSIAVDGVMASAAYEIGSAADRILATVSSRVGSIGVYLMHLETSKADEQAGYTYTILHRPPLKIAGNSVEPLSKEAREALEQTIVEPGYARFVDRVAKFRGVSEDTVRTGYGQGLALPADQALVAGLIDGIIDWDDYLAAGSSASVSDHSVSLTEAHMNPRLKALLFGAGILADGNAADDVATAVLLAWATGRGIQLPDASDPAAQLAAVSKALTSPPAAAGQAASPPATVPAVDPTAIAAAAQQAVMAERQRVEAIQARANLLGLEANAAEIATAITNGQTADAFAAGVVNAALAANRPLVARVDPTESQVDKFSEAAVAALTLRCQAAALGAIGPDVDSGAAREALLGQIRQNPMVRQVAGMSMAEIARQACQVANIRVAEHTDLAYAEAFLRMHGNQRHLFAVGHPRIAGADLLAVDALVGPGDYPRIMDGVANKIVRFALAMAPVSYMMWCSRMDDLPNFSPKEVITFGHFGELPIHIDGKPYSQKGPLPLEAAWIQAEEYGEGIVYTPRMFIQDGLNVLVRTLTQLQISHEKTVNRLCINLLTGNVEWLVDGVACYSHTNDVTDGGGPSAVEFRAMEKLLAQQKLVSATEESGLDLRWILTGSEWKRLAKEVCLDVEKLVWQTTQEETNSFRGEISPYYDPMISSSGTGLVWYGGADPRLEPGISYAFMAGNGPGGRRVSYYDDATGSLVYRIEGRFGAALLNAQALVRNSGVAATTTTTTTGGT